MVVCLGELLIDFVSLESGVSLEQAPAFQKAPGGAPANVAVGLAKLGHEVGFIGKVGDESFGHFLANVLRENGVDISGLSFDSKTRTMLAFVSLTSEGERDFMFYRHPSADMRLTPEDIPEDLIKQAAIFHYGSISLISEPCRSATCHVPGNALKAVDTTGAGDGFVAGLLSGLLAYSEPKEA
jgi:fructokinase